MNAYLLALAALLFGGCDSVTPKQKDFVYEGDLSSGTVDPSSYYVNFVGLENTERTAMDEVDLSIEFRNASSSATWSLYHSTNSETMENAVAIYTEMPITQTNVTWDVSFMDPGTYFLFIVIDSGGISTIHKAPGSFIVGEGGTGNRAPFITIESPTGSNPTDRPGLILTPGQSVNIDFTAIDTDEDPFTVRFEYSSDLGSNWTVIEDNVDYDLLPDGPNGTKQRSWTVPAGAVETARWMLRVVGTDVEGNEGFGEMALPFGVAAVRVDYTAIRNGVLAGACDSCHNGATGIARNNFVSDLYDADPANNNEDGVYEQRVNIVSRTVIDAPAFTNSRPFRMPPNGATLNDTQRDLLQLWLWGNPQQATP